ncbi:hypothetical protein D3C71_1785950 [compost metagenome]
MMFLFVVASVMIVTSGFTARPSVSSVIRFPAIVVDRLTLAVSAEAPVPRPEKSTVAESLLVTPTSGASIHSVSKSVAEFLAKS